MRPKIHWFISCILAFLPVIPVYLSAQSVYISKYVSASSTQANDRIHRIELFNESSEIYQDLSGYLLMTRNYIFQFPPNTSLRPLQSLRLGYENSQGDLSLAYSRYDSWKQRESTGSQGGDFALLFDDGGELVDAFYFSMLETVDFLPSTEVWTQENQEKIRLLAPDESSPDWFYLKASQDPAFAFFRISGRWQVGSRNKNILPAVKYRTPKAIFQEGIVTLSWATQEERDCFFHRVERSTDGKNYKFLADVVGNRISSQEQNYAYFDLDVEQDRLYFYRIANTDKFGNEVYSTPVKIRSEEGLGQFVMEILEGDVSSKDALNLRFSGKEEQQIRIQLMDEEMREIAVLYYGTIEANRQNLVIYEERLPVGKYFVIVSTETKRYYEPFIIE